MTFEEAIKDIDFQGLPPAERHKVLVAIDADYAGLPMEEQQKVLSATGGSQPSPVEQPAQPGPSTPEWAGKHPNPYGVYGALTETPKAIGEFFGMDKITQPIAQVAAHTLAKSNAERAGVGTPTAGELANAALNTGALLLPYGKVAGGVANVAGKVLPKAAAKIAGVMGAGATGGYMVEAGEKLAKGEAPTPGLTTALGAVIPGAVVGAGKAGQWVAEKATHSIPARLMNSLIKGRPIQNYSYGKNPGRVLAEEGVIANSIEDLADIVPKKRLEIGNRLETVAKELDIMAANKQIKIDLRGATAPIKVARAKAMRMPLENKALLARLDDLETDISGLGDLSNLGFNNAVQIKRTIGDNTKWTGQWSDDIAINKVKKEVYGRINSNIKNDAVKVDPDLSRVFAKLNEKYGDITSAEIAVKYRNNIMQRGDIFSLKGHLGALSGALTTTIITGGATIPAVIAGLSGAALDKTLGSAAVKTRVATWLAKARPEDLLNLTIKAPKIAQALNRAFGEKVRLPGDIIFQGRKVPSGAIKDLKSTPEQLPDYGRKANIERKIREGDIEGLGKLAYEDPLTGILNRQAFDEAYPQAIKQGKKFASLDVSGLKYVNDKYGHKAGDTLLKEYTKALKDAGVDIYRVGGDETYAIFGKGDYGKLKMAQRKFSLKEIPVEDLNGNSIALKGASFDFGIGKTLKEGDIALIKKRTKKARADRGEKPIGLDESDPLGIR